MNEQEWLTCADPQPMLEFLKGGASERKLRLFAVACCQLMLQKVCVHPWYVHGIAVTGRFADGEATVEELERVGHYPSSDWCLQFASQFNHDRAAPAGQPHRVTKLAINACWNAMEVEGGVVMADCASTNAAWAATQPGPVMPDDRVSAGRLAAEQAIQCGILRDIIGNPFLPLALNPIWLSSTVKNLAESVYTDGAFGKMPILGDALEDAGCDNEDILKHCREPGEHCRGCWCLDLVLGKS
jgi:hypothetical protein